MKQNRRNFNLLRADGATTSPNAFDPAGTSSSGISAHLLSFNHANLPTDDEKDALVGTFGTASGTNAYVTNLDPRNSDARNPLAHVHAPADISPQGSGSTLDADLLDGYHAVAFASAVHGHAPGDISPQGSGSTLDADLLDGYDALSFATAVHVHSPADIVPQGSGSTLDADLLDGVHASDFGTASGTTALLGMPYVTWGGAPGLTNNRILAPGTGMSETISGSNLYLTNNGVWSITGSAFQINASTPNHNVLLSLPDEPYLGVPSATTGSLRLYNAGAAGYTRIAPGAHAADLTFTLPTAYPAASGYALVSTDAGVMSFSAIASPPAAKTAVYVDAGGALAGLTLGNGELMIGSAGAIPSMAGLTAVANQTTVTPGAGSITVGTVQDIGTGSTPQFARLGLGAAADATIPLYVSSGIVGIGVNANSKMTTGLTLNQGDADNEIFACKSSDVAHGMTGRTETDTYFTIQKSSATAGGAYMWGFAESGASALYFIGAMTVDNTTKTSAGVGAIQFVASTKSGTSTGASAADANLCTFGTWGAAALFIMDKEGQLHINETSTDTFPTIDMKQSSTGDVGIRCGLGSTMSAMIGLDNSEAGDRLAIAFAASATAVLGTGDVFALWSTGNCQSGPDGAGATNATTGYWYVRTCAGTPTGVPTAITGYAAMRYDSTNAKMYVYNVGTAAWVALN